MSAQNQWIWQVLCNSHVLMAFTAVQLISCADSGRKQNAPESLAVVDTVTSDRPLKEDDQHFSKSEATPRSEEDCQIKEVDRPAGSVRDDNGPKTKLVWCPPGRFAMGTREAQGTESIYFNEHKVEVTLTRGFWLGMFEVTQREWIEVMDTKPWSGKTFVENVGRAKEGDNYPAVWINWNDATEYCRRLTESERKASRLKPSDGYKLPTEAQWEYACRAGTSTTYSFGSDLLKLRDHAWYGAFVDAGNAANEPYAHPVGQKRSNAWGLYDMHGNVYEFCSDYHEDKVAGGCDPTGPETGSNRTMRGGSWYGSSSYCRSAFRLGAPPDFHHLDTGFRVALVTAEE